VHAKKVNFNGHVDILDRKGILSLSLKNNSRHSVCFQEWDDSENGLPITIYSNDFIIRNSQNTLVEYIGPMIMPSSLKKSYRYYVLSPGSELNQKINLSATYSLLPGKYTLTYFLSVINCEALSYEQIMLEPSIYLKSIYLQQNNDAKLLRKKIDSFHSGVWDKYGDILVIDSLAFEIPNLN
jgi:hypothetical protein